MSVLGEEILFGGLDVLVVVEVVPDFAWAVLENLDDYCQDVFVGAFVFFCCTLLFLLDEFGILFVVEDVVACGLQFGEYVFDL